MSTELAVIEREAANLTASEIRAQVNLIQEVMKSVMKDGEHFGKIPGCGPKPTLLKAGAEKLASTFRFAIDPEIQDLSDKDVVRYRIRARVTHQVTGYFLGTGIGEASSGEEKYNWRKAVCQEEWDETPEDRRRRKWSSYQGDTKRTLQIRTHPADVANTVLKMAKKRAMVDAVLSVCAASDLFSQDLEDLPPEILERETARATGVVDMSKVRAGQTENRGHGNEGMDQVKQPATSAPKANGNVISEKQAKRLWAIAKGKNLSNDDIKSILGRWGCEHTKDIPTSDYEAIIAAIEAPAPTQEDFFEREPGSEG
jgi:hypothetical protein